MDIILASASPRRRELLKQMDLDFTVLPSGGAERITKIRPQDVVVELAVQKASEVAKGRDGDALVIGADTVVAIGDRILGKPKDEKEAEEMLLLLSGKTHQVYTGVCLIEKKGKRERRHSFYEKTDVEFYPMSGEEIQSYVETGDPLDKAGAYGIQTGCAVYIRGICGDYNNVVGLPIARLYHEMQRLRREESWDI